MRLNARVAVARCLMPLRFQKSNRRWTQMDIEFEVFADFYGLTRWVSRETVTRPWKSAFIRVHLRFQNPF